MVLIKRRPPKFFRLEMLRQYPQLKNKQWWYIGKLDQCSGRNYRMALFNPMQMSDSCFDPVRQVVCTYKTCGKIQVDEVRWITTKRRLRFAIGWYANKVYWGRRSMSKTEFVMGPMEIVDWKLRKEARNAAVPV